MASIKENNLELNYGWTYGESGWNSGMDENIVKLGFESRKRINGILSSPPSSSPSNGDAYIVGTSPTGLFSGKFANIAIYDRSSWVFITPKSQEVVFNTSDGCDYIYNNSWSLKLEAEVSPYIKVKDFTFSTGYTITDQKQCLLNITDNHYYQWNGTFPKVVAAGATPATSGGIGAGAWVDRTDVALRNDLSAPGGAGLVGVTSETGFQTLPPALNYRLVIASSINELKNIPLPVGSTCYLSNYGRSGMFRIKKGAHPIDPDEGIWIDMGNGNYAERVNNGYLDLGMFGGNSMTNDPFKNLQIAINHSQPGGTVSTSGISGIWDIDYRLSIEKPINVLSDKSVLFRLINQSTLFHSTFNGAKDLVSIKSSSVTFKGFQLDSNKLNNYVTVNGINYYFLEEPQLVGGSISDIRYLGCIRVISPDENTPLTNISIEDNWLNNCSVHAIGVQGPKSMAYFQANGRIRKQDFSLYSRKIVIKNNYFSGGCRSGAFFIGGVVDSVFEDNTCENWAWAGFRFYYGTDSCVMRNNTTLLNKSINLTEYESSVNNVSEYVGIGYRVGHGKRAPGTCTNSQIIGNQHITYGEGRPFSRPLVSIHIEAGSNYTTVKGNIVRGSGNQTIDSQFTGAVFVSKGSDNVEFIDNIVDTVEMTMFRVSGAHNEFMVSGNHFNFKGSIPINGGSIYPKVFFMFESEVSGYIVDNKSSGILSFINADPLSSLTVARNDVDVFEYYYPGVSLFEFSCEVFCYDNKVVARSGNLSNLRLYATSLATKGGVFDNNTIYSKIGGGVTSDSAFLKHLSSNVLVTKTNNVLEVVQ